MNRLIVATIAGAMVGAAGTFAVLGRDQTLSGPQTQDVVRDLGNVVKMSETAATLHRAERFENLNSIEQLLALPTEFAQTEALYAVAGRADSGAVQNLIYEANRIADPLDRDAALGILFSRLTELDAPSALAMARTNLFSVDRGIESQVWKSWGKLDLDGALTAAKAQTAPAKRNLAAQALFSAYGYMGNESTARIESELDIRPDSTTRSRYLYGLADRSPINAVEYVDGIRSHTTQRQMASWLARYLARNDPERAATYADLFTDASLRRIFSQAVSNAAVTADPAAVLDRIIAGGVSGEDMNQAYYAMRELVARDIDSAIQYFENVSSQQLRSTFGRTIAQELTRLDPARALDWARNNDRGEHRRLLPLVLAQIALTDPLLAMDEAKSIRHGGQRGEAMHNIVRTLAREEPGKAAEFIGRIENARERDSAASSLVYTWMRDDPDAALDWVMSNEITDRKMVLAMTGENLARWDIDSAIRLLPRLDEASAVGWRRTIAQNLASEASAERALGFIRQFEGKDDYAALQEAVAKGVAENDITLAKQLADQLPAGMSRDGAYAQIVAQHANTNPAQAAAWLRSISDEQQRSFATRQLMSAWSQQDQEAALRWVGQLPRGTQRDDAIVGLASNWEELTPSRRDLVESIGDADKRTRARIAQIYLVARTDWSRAQTMLNEADLPGLERQRVQRSIDRYRNR